MPHYTDLTAATCWLCDRERGELCHVHDPAERRHLAVKDGERERPEEPGELAWAVDASRER